MTSEQCKVNPIRFHKEMQYKYVREINEIKNRTKEDIRKTSPSTKPLNRTKTYKN